MSVDAVEQSLRQILAKIEGCFLPAEAIRPDHRLREDLGLDSLAMIDLLVEAEDEFGIHFDPLRADLASAFETVRSLAELIEEIQVSS